MMAALVGALTVLTGCQGFMGLDYDSAKYIAGAKHEALAQCVAADAKGLDALMVLAKDDKGELKAYAEVEGFPVMSAGKPRRLLPNPRWPRAMPVATRRGTPQELGLITVSAERCAKGWLLYTPENARLVGHYYACKALYTDTTIATDGSSYWLEATVGGKVYAETTRGGHLDHYDKAFTDGWKVQWKGTLKQYIALGERHVDQAYMEAKRKEAHAFIAIIPPSYWLR